MQVKVSDPGVANWRIGGEMVVDFKGEIAARRARLEKIGDYL
jgi:hypothetical protein